MRNSRYATSTPNSVFSLQNSLSLTIIGNQGCVDQNTLISIWMSNLDWICFFSHEFHPNICQK